jgi:hypothetical protein
MTGRTGHWQRMTRLYLALLTLACVAVAVTPLPA